MATRPMEHASIWVDDVDVKFVEGLAHCTITSNGERFEFVLTPNVLCRAIATATRAYTAFIKKAGSLVLPFKRRSDDAPEGGGATH